MRKFSRDGVGKVELAKEGKFAHFWGVSMSRKERLDRLLFEKGLVSSYTKGRQAIEQGRVLVNGRVYRHTMGRVEREVAVAVSEEPKFVGRGGWKLERALEAFGIDVEGCVCLDVGASTGGFTDCLLQRGALRVHAVDVGQGQMVEKIREDARVVVREKCNARYLREEDLGEKVGRIVMDVSFISQTKILPVLFPLLEEGGCVVSLVKPQFELQPEDIGKGGIVDTEEKRERAIANVRACVEAAGREWCGVVESPIQGGDGNVEFLAWMR